MRQKFSGVPRPKFDQESERQRQQRLYPKAHRLENLQLRRAPLLVAALCFALGESLSRIPPHAPRQTLLLATAAIALAAASLWLLRRSPRVAMLSAAALWIAIGLWSVQIAPAPSQQTSLTEYADGLSRTVRGRVVRVRRLPPRARDQNSDFDWDQWEEASGRSAVSVDLAVSAIEDVTPDTSRMVPLSGGVRATLFSGSAAPNLHCGDTVELPLRLRVPERYGDPGAFQYADFLAAQGIAVTASARADGVQTISTPRSADLRCSIFGAQQWAAARLTAYAQSRANRSLPALLQLAPEDVSMLNAMLFGDRSGLTHPARVAFERTGSFHLFVVSGLHVALLAAILLWLARRARLGQLAATLITLPITAAYALLTGFGVPVQRALLMTAVFLVARLISRQRNSLNALGAAALAVLVWSPTALFEASFQMTFLAIVAIAGIAVPLGERSFLPYARATRRLRQVWRDASMLPRIAQFRVFLRIWSDAFARRFGGHAYFVPGAIIRPVLVLLELMLVGVVTEAVMALPMALYFHRATPFALPANLLTIPLVGVLASLGLITFAASLISPWLAAAPSATLACLLHALTAAMRAISRMHAADVRVPGPTLLQILGCLACIGFCCWAVRRSRALAAAGCAALVLAVCFAAWPAAPIRHAGELEVSAIDVGQGDSLLIVGPSGRTMLIDAGGPTGAAANAENAAGSASFDVGEEVVSPYLWSRQIRRLDVIALSHAHSDHMGGMAAVVRNFRPRELWVSLDPNSDSFRALLTEAAEYGTTVRHLRAGQRVAWDALSIGVLAPAPFYSNAGAPANNDSLVLRLQFGRASALLEGDAEAPSEEAMAYAALHGGPAVGPDTLLKVGHHGSRTSTTPAFLALASPRDAVISVGRQNTFGHPRPEVLQRLADAHARVFRTDRGGLRTFLLTRDGGISEGITASNP